MHEFEVRPYLYKRLIKLSKKDNGLYNRVIKKIDRIVNSSDIDHYKNLQHGLKEVKRVHIGHFVLIFSYDPKKDRIIFEDFDHHDKIYSF